MNESSSHELIESIYIVINVNGINECRYTLKLLERPVNRNPEDYRLVIVKAERMIAGLQNIQNKQ